jgi:AraC family transcriptional regulator, transcriptional activator FtrA
VEVSRPAGPAATGPQTARRRPTAAGPGGTATQMLDDLALGPAPGGPAARLRPGPRGSAADAGRARPHRVVALALPGLITFDLTCALQVFGHGPNLEFRTDLYELVVCGPGGEQVPTYDGFDLAVRHGLGALDTADTVVVAGYRGAWDTPPSGDVLAALRRAAARGARVMSICVGAFALGHAGLLRGRRATTHWAATEALAGQFPETTVIDDVLYIDDGDILTSAGLASGLDLALHLTRRDHGSHAAAELARWNVVAPHRDGAQAQFIRIAIPTSTSSLDETCQWALRHLDEPLGLAELAGHANLSERSLLRRFQDEIGTSPKQWLLRARLDRARELLETTDLPVEAVARRTGFSSSAGLRDRFTAALGTSPTAYRLAFRQ